MRTRKIPASTKLAAFVICATQLTQIASPQTASGAPLEVKAVRFRSFSRVTRIAIEVNGDFHFRSDHIDNPDRLFFDLMGARPRVNGRRLLTREVNDKLLKRIRVAETLPGVTRVVLDLAAPVDYTASQLENPGRLIVELRPIHAAPPDIISRVTTPLTPAPTLEPTLPGAIVFVPPSKPPAIPSRALLPSTPPTLTPRTETPISFTTLGRIAPPMNRRVAEPVAVVKTMPKPPALPRSAANAAQRTTTDGNRSLIRALGLKVNRVVIDAGHGGHDQGTSGDRGLLEKDLVLDVALRVGKLIEQRMGSEVIYTRTDDTFVPLHERTALANERKADLFLSIHANSSSATQVAGVETYYLNLTSSPEGLDVAARENATSEKSIYELRDLVDSIAKHDKVEESKEFATDVQASLQTFAAKYSPSAKDRGIRKAPFVVLIGAQMPSILAEIGFLSNSREENLLSRPEHRQRLAEALYKGLSRYMQTLSHFEIARRVPDRTIIPDEGPASK